MISQDQLAAATIAQIFGSELMHAQQNAQTDSGARPEFVKVHPRDILMKGQQQSRQQQSLEQKRMLEALQREAEASCPLPPDPVNQQAAVPPPVQQPVSVPQPQTFTGQNPFPQPILPINNSSLTASTTSDVWSSIAHSLQRIADRLDTVEITLKKRRVKRK